MPGPARRRAGCSRIRMQNKKWLVQESRAKKPYQNQWRVLFLQQVGAQWLQKRLCLMRAKISRMIGNVLRPALISDRHPGGAK